MTYSEAIDFLYSLRWYGAKLGLQNTFKLADMVGQPQARLRFIHVAGTNGKGSTCAMLESIYRRAGVKTGLFTSPHLVSFGERIQINRKPISQEEIVALVEEIKPLMTGFTDAGHPTFFEVVTVMALLHFARNGCELVVWETGLGGRLDATNIVTPLLSVITNIQYDHQKWLGESLTSIASEKAGIIKPGVPVVTGAEAPDALRVIRDRAQEQGCELTVVTDEATREPPLDNVVLPLIGAHQRRNAAVAVAAVRQIREIPVSPDQLRDGLRSVVWPGRLQVIEGPGDRKIVLDGAHNPAGAEVLSTTIKEHFPGVRPTYILGILADKDLVQMCEWLGAGAGRLLLVPVHSERTADPGLLASVCRRANAFAEIVRCESLSEALEKSQNDKVTVITGSLYLVGEAMELLNLSPTNAPGPNERPLNEWGAPLSKPGV